MPDQKRTLEYASPRATAFVTSDALAIENNPMLIEGAARAIVFLTVEWSTPEQIGRKIIHEALTSMPTDVQFEFFVLTEDDPRSATWLLKHGWPYHDPLGYGSVLWFEWGALVTRELDAHLAGAKQIVERTLSRWRRDFGN